MEWTDRAVVLSARRHGETSAVVSLLTRDHGRHAGLVRGAFASRARGLFEPGGEVSARWRARLEEHLGTFTCEPVRSHAAALMDDARRLAVLASACAVADAALPERQPHAEVYDDMLDLLRALAGPGFAAAYVRWELRLLGDLGFGLDLGACAATGESGANDRLAFVSPRSGRAVSESAGAPWRAKLLPLPAFLLADAAGEGGAEAPGGGGADARALAEGLRLTGFFLERHVFAPHGRGLPAARTRLVDRLTA